MLHVRAGVPRQGDPHHRGPGPGDRRALHRLRELRAGLLATRQAAPQHGRRSTAPCSLPAAAWRPAWPPAFPPSSSTWTTRRWSACCAQLGFALVVEVAFGADLVARQYWELLLSCNGQSLYLHDLPRDRHFRRALLPGIGPLAGPHRVADDRHGPGTTRQSTANELKIVFIGPCIAKKMEAKSESVAGEIDAVITFSELRRAVRRGGHRSRPASSRATSTRPAARPAACSPSAAACSRRPTCAKTCSPARSWPPRAAATCWKPIKEFADGDLGAKLLEAAVLRRLHHGRRA